MPGRGEGGRSVRRSSSGLGVGVPSTKTLRIEDVRQQGTSPFCHHYLTGSPRTVTGDEPVDSRTRWGNGRDL